MSFSDRISSYCATNHLTSYGTGFFKAQNTIDFEFIFADFDFADNVTIFVVILVTMILFLITLIWAQIRDRKDIKEVITKLRQTLCYTFIFSVFSKSPTG